MFEVGKLPDESIDSFLEELGNVSLLSSTSVRSRKSFVSGVFFFFFASSLDINVNSL
jgi:hypothetical protein